MQTNKKYKTHKANKLSTDVEYNLKNNKIKTKKTKTVRKQNTRYKVHKHKEKIIKLAIYNKEKFKILKIHKIHGKRSGLRPSRMQRQQRQTNFYKKTNKTIKLFLKLKKDWRTKA